jgi:serine-type D-Ala-D-Ala carboxypeptidase (penicillin-binding protein 5/6)
VSHPRFRSRGSLGSRTRRHRISLRALGVTAAVALCLGIVGAVVFVTVQLLQPTPALTFTATPPPPRALPGAPPRAAWPGRAEAVVGTPGTGILATHGGTKPRPIASLAKIMTAYVVLRDHPLRPTQEGPRLAVTGADVAAYRQDQKQGQSVVEVAAGERLTERDALTALLIPSGNNIADLLATWDAGSRSAFVAKMNGQARSLGMRRTHYADSSGVDPATVSTAADQFRLAVRALRLPVLRQIVALPQAWLPVAGVVYNVNSGLGHLGIDGIKTGSTPQARGCLVFSAERRVAGRPVPVIGAVLGVPATSAQPSELAGVVTASERLLRSVGGNLERVHIVRPGRVLGRVRTAWGASTAAVAATGVTAIGWPGMPARVTVTTLPLHPGIRPGQHIARATVTVGGSVSHIWLNASRPVPAPSLSWRLSHV